MRGETETEFKTQFLSALNKSGVTQESILNPLLFTI